MIALESDLHADGLVTANIQFLQWQPLYEHEKPFQLFLDIPPDAPDQRKTNLVFEPKDVLVENMRGREASFSLDGNGFMVRQLSGFQDLNSADVVTSEYLPAVEKLLKAEVEGADRVEFFDWRLRDSDPAPSSGTIDLSNNLNPLKPSNVAHGDQAPASVVNRVLTDLRDEAESLLKGRVRVINIWKPLRNEVRDWPLAMNDGSTISVDDLVETDTIRSTCIGSNLFAKFCETQRWYYLKCQQPEEVIIFKQFDSEPDVRAALSVHSSFQYQGEDGKGTPRKSIEVRALVFTNPDN